MTADPRALVAKGSRILAENGHSDMVWGHLSMRDPGGAGVWIKPAGLGFEEIDPSDVHLLSWEGEILEGEGPKHLEAHIHLEVMRARPDVMAVIHSHPEAAVTLAATGMPLLAIGHEATFFTPPDVARFHETGDLIRTPELGQSVAHALGERNALLLVNHGIVVAESSVERAVFGAILLEKASRMTLAAATAMGGVTSTLLTSDNDEALAKRDRCYSDTQVGHGWNYLERTTRTSATPSGGVG